MRRSILSLTAAAAMLALGACSSDTVDQGRTSGNGNAGAYGRSGAQSSEMTGAQRLAQLQNELQTSVGDRVFFGTDSYDVNTAQARQTLDRQVAFLQRYPDIRVAIQGHADERGTREYNLALGDRRANSVKEYLMANGVSASRLSTVSFGKERPEAVGANEAAWAKNRRAVTVISQ